MRRDPEFPDVPPDGPVDVFNGHLSDLRSWLELAEKHADKNQAHSRTLAYQEFRTLCVRVEEALMAATCNHEWERGGNCPRLVEHEAGIDGLFCNLHGREA